MSGGSFDYAFTKVSQFACELEVKLDTFDTPNEWGECYNKFEPETLEKLHEILKQCEYTAQLMKEVEWLYSGDTGDESFMERVREIESNWGKA